MSDNHECPDNPGNIVFYSKLWGSLAFKIFPANYDKMPDEYKQMPQFQPMMITIKNCPYCGKSKEEMEEFK